MRHKCSTERDSTRDRYGGEDSDLRDFSVLLLNVCEKTTNGALKTCPRRWTRNDTRPAHRRWNWSQAINGVRLLNSARQLTKADSARDVEYECYSALVTVLQLVVSQQWVLWRVDR